MNAPSTHTSQHQQRLRLLGAAAGALAVVGLGAMAVRWWRRRRAAATAVSGLEDDSSAAVPAVELPYDVLLFDIEGTTTPISFVKETLFPYVTRTLPQYLQAHYDEPETRADLEALIQLAAADVAAGTPGAVPIPPFPEGPITVTSEFAQRQIEAVIANVAWQMATDRKSTALKALQGHMWLGGYTSGELKGRLFGDANGDVAKCMRAWKKEGYRLAIYSSGSVAAQQLLFRHSQAGDLTPLLDAYFDTKVGMKQDPESYETIASQLNVPTGRILFLTDIYGEAAAAEEAGVASVILVRPGNGALPSEQRKRPFPLARSFYAVQEHLHETAMRRAYEEATGTIYEGKFPKGTFSHAASSATAAARKVDTSSGQYNSF